MFGDEGLAKLVDNATILDSSSLVYKGTAEGEFPLGITMEYAAFRYVAGGNRNVKLIYPSDGVISAPEGAAVIKGCRHPEEAQLLVDYLLSKEVEDMIFEKYYRRPARARRRRHRGAARRLFPEYPEILRPGGGQRIEGNHPAQVEKAGA